MVTVAYSELQSVPLLASGLPGALWLAAPTPVAARDADANDDDDEYKAADTGKDYG
ncbi:hypothetical protein DPMN_178523 [Dreissena polymorpha]|uniref:Uncharacterized protein n=1 Tax=Dreissena polymorpha TaxID=45954 RepID=A0A9D4EEC9_DREPO|nr:hypothetical protein DPMN_178523 [Dreissena polymorpha]